jgi:hypothetical protein
MDQLHSLNLLYLYILGTYLSAASLTFALGLAKSSLKRELCSVNLLNFNSAIDCLCGRDAIILDVLGRKDVARVEGYVRLCSVGNDRLMCEGIVDEGA